MTQIRIPKDNGLRNKVKKLAVLLEAKSYEWGELWGKPGYYFEFTSDTRGSNHYEFPTSRALHAYLTDKIRLFS